MHKDTSLDPVREKLRDCISSKTNSILADLIKDKYIAQLGDSLTNFIYSLAISVARDKCVGRRVPDSVLANAYHSSVLKTLISARGKKGKIGDVVEAVLLLSWLSEGFELEEMAEIIASHLEITKTSTRKDEFLAAAGAFQKLLDEIAARIDKISNRMNCLSPSKSSR